MGRPVAKPRTLSRARTPARANSAVVLCHPALSGAASSFKRASANRALCTPQAKVGTSSSVGRASAVKSTAFSRRTVESTAKASSRLRSAGRVDAVEAPT